MKFFSKSSDVAPAAPASPDVFALAANIDSASAFGDVTGKLFPAARLHLEQPSRAETESRLLMKQEGATATSARLASIGLGPVMCRAEGAAVARARLVAQGSIPPSPIDSRAASLELLCLCVDLSAEVIKPTKPLKGEPKVHAFGQLSDVERGELGKLISVKSGLLAQIVGVRTSRDIDDAAFEVRMFVTGDLRK